MTLVMPKPTKSMLVKMNALVALTIFWIFLPGGRGWPGSLRGKKVKEKKLKSWHFLEWTRLAHSLAGYGFNSRWLQQQFKHSNVSAIFNWVYLQNPVISLWASHSNQLNFLWDILQTLQINEHIQKQAKTLRVTSDSNVVFTLFFPTFLPFYSLVVLILAVFEPPVHNVANHRRGDQTQELEHAKDGGVHTH